ncbi:hypothetical protein, partial [Microcystis sp. LEGE 00066]|uniref:hypothetical protein n=1 Tax=Microcystis sp. LEGE 00066 TaxID=1828685 RepID=UPI001D143BE2
MAEFRRQKAKGKRQKAKGKRQKAKGKRQLYTIFLYLRHNECKLGKHSSVDVCHGFRNLVLFSPHPTPHT